MNLYVVKSERTVTVYSYVHADNPEQAAEIVVDGGYDYDEDGQARFNVLHVAEAEVGK